MSKHTPGPWRWEFNSGSRNLHLVGGKPRYDLTIMDFVRWGMDGATVRLRDTEHERLQLLHKLHERPDWIKPFEGRQHHADWCADVIHPDMRLIACAPELLAAAQHINEVAVMVPGTEGQELCIPRSALDALLRVIGKATAA